MAKPKTANYRAFEGPFRQFLADRDMEIKDLADKTGIHRKTISEAINGNPMTWATLARVALALNVAPDALAEPITDGDAEAVSA